ncbi:MAG: hypothetical protein Q9167_001923 [Letrouitia subvulpina]
MSLHDPSFFASSRELFDLSPFLFQALLHPIQAVKTNLPFLRLPQMFGGNTFRPESDIPSLGGKVILVTGGKESILQLCKHEPAHVFLAARTLSKGEAAVQDIKKAVPSANVTYLKLDLASFSSISNAVRDFRKMSDRLDLLLNNAGIMATPLATTEEGYESQFGTNYMGHALLTKLLLPTLLSTASEPCSDVRIVNLTSEGHHLAPEPAGILFEKSALDQKGAWTRYGQSKLANILFTRELAKRYMEIKSVAVHPGLIKTSLYEPTQRNNAILRYGLKVIGPLIMSDVQTGALTQLWAAGAHKDQVESGFYYTPIARANQGSKRAQDDQLAERLWDWTESELKAKGF